MRKRFVSFIMSVLMMVSGIVIGTAGVSADVARGPIKGNGTNGIYIDILGYPYTNYATIPDYGQAAYSNLGCAWFASARAKQLTGKGYTIYSGYNWYNSTYAVFGFSRGSVPKAKALACFANHVSVIERVDGDTLTISEGGVQGDENAQYGHCHIITKNRYTFEAGNRGTGAFLGYVYLGVTVDSEPLTKPAISTDKTSYEVGDTVNVSWTASSANSPLSHYWIIITTPSGDTLVNKRIDNATSYSFTVTEEGKYHVKTFATPVGSQSGEGSLTDEVDVTVEKKAGKPQLNVSAGTSVSDTVFSWEAVENAIVYLVHVKKTDGTLSRYIEPLKGETIAKEILSAGEYKAVVSAFSPSGSETVSDEVSFTVKKQNSGDSGWIYSDTKPTGLDSGKYEIQRKYTYEKTSSEDMGTGWTKGEFVETKFENKGDPYWSNIELATSDTRVLLNYIYYHYCGSGGNSANFTSISSHPHYDWISKDKVNEQSVHSDYDDARYKYYHLTWKTGGDAYCSSGVTCDGSFGSHGNRCYYWYKSSQYQDKVRADYYSYTNTTDWTSALQTGYSEITYRYRLKEGTSLILGDSNLDGDVNIKDATVIQKYLVAIEALSDDAKLCADANLDGDINIKDATEIQKFTASLLPSDTKVGKYI